MTTLKKKKKKNQKQPHSRPHCLFLSRQPLQREANEEPVIGALDFWEKKEENMSEIGESLHLSLGQQFFFLVVVCRRRLSRRMSLSPHCRTCCIGLAAAPRHRRGAAAAEDGDAAAWCGDGASRLMRAPLSPRSAPDEGGGERREASRERKYLEK